MARSSAPRCCGPRASCSTECCSPEADAVFAWGGCRFDLARTAPGFDFVSYLKGIGTPVDTIIVGQPSAITGIAALIAQAPIGVLRDQLLIRSLDGFADVLPARFGEAGCRLGCGGCRWGEADAAGA